MGCVLILLAACHQLPYASLGGYGRCSRATNVRSHAGTERLDISVSWDDYWQQVEESHQEITELEQIPLDQARARLEGLALQWDALTRWNCPMGASWQWITVTWFHCCAIPAPDLARIEQLLAALLAERESSRPGAVLR